MTETTMPAAEAAVATSADDERGRYELAFHVLPTVAEGEVAGIVDTIKTHIAGAGGEIFDEEAAERFDLAYEIVENVEGKNRKFASAYFGWVRFVVDREKIEVINEEVEAMPAVLRKLMIRLTRVEEAHPFRFHEALKAQQQVTTVEESKVVPDTTTVAEAPAEAKTEEKEEAGEVDDKAVDEALKKDVA